MNIQLSECAEALISIEPVLLTRALAAMYGGLRTISLSYPPRYRNPHFYFILLEAMSVQITVFFLTGIPACNNSIQLLLYGIQSFGLPDITW